MKIKINLIFIDLISVVCFVKLGEMIYRLNTVLNRSTTGIFWLGIDEYILLFI